MNEIDISAVFTRKKGEQEPEEAASGTTQGGNSDHLCSQSGAEQVDDRLSQMSIEELLELMSLESADNQYRQLAQLLLREGSAAQTGAQFRPALQRAGRHDRAARGPDQEHRLSTGIAVLQQLTPGELTEHLLDHLEDAEFGQKELVFLILQTVGAEIVEPVVRRLIAVGFKASRKTFTTALFCASARRPNRRFSRFCRTEGGRSCSLPIAILGEWGAGTPLRSWRRPPHSNNRVRVETSVPLPRSADGGHPWLLICCGTRPGHRASMPSPGLGTPGTKGAPAVAAADRQARSAGQIHRR